MFVTAVLLSLDNYVYNLIGKCVEVICQNTVTKDLGIFEIKKGFFCLSMFYHIIK